MSTARPPCSRICSRPRWRASANNKGWGRASTSSASRTSCSRWTPPPSRCAWTLFPWAKFRRAKGGVKAHVLLDHDDYLPAYVLITEAKRSDVKLADSFALNPGSIVAMDRGYNDYALFGRWTRPGVFFVTRLKDNAAYEVVEECAVPQHRNILADQLIRFTGAQAQADCPHLLRRVVVWDAENEREIVLLTNLLEFGATTIAAIYKDRWEIELFFKALKQNLKVKSFVGTSENALRIQIWTALIAMLLLKWLHHLSKANWSLSNLASMLRLNLFTYRDLTHWLDDPMGTPPLVPAAEQLTLALVIWTGCDNSNRRPPPKKPGGAAASHVFSAARATGLSCLGQQCFSIVLLPNPHRGVRHPPIPNGGRGSIAELLPASRPASRVGWTSPALS